MDNRYLAPRAMKTIFAIIGQLLATSLLLAEATPGSVSEATVASAPAQKMVMVGEIKMDSSVGENGSLNPRSLLNLRKDLVASFVKTRKFAVLDREFGDQIAAEKHPSNPDRSEAGRTDKLGEEVTADYLISGAVKRYTNTTVEQEMRLSGRKQMRYKFDVNVAIQVIDVASKRVVFADSFSEKTSGVVQAGSPTFDSWADDAISRVAARACNSVLELVYPLKVVSIADGGEVILNEGSGRVAEGDLLEVYALGKPLTDPDTGVEIGREETLQAKIKVTRVLPKASYALTETQPGGTVTPGSICRKSKKQDQPTEMGTGDSSAPAGPKKVKVEGDL